MDVLHYLLEANLYLVAFYMLYILLLRSDTHYNLNRTYLLVTSTLAFIIPLLQLGILKPEPTAISAQIMPMEGFTTMILPAQQATQLTYIDYILITYGIVSAALFMHLLFKIYKLIALAKRGNAIRKNGYVMIELPGNNIAFSFFGYLFIDNKLSLSQTILHHEEVHIRQKHSWDILYLELLKIVNWFNPFIYLLQKSVKEVHEFIADQQAASFETDSGKYTDFLISNAYGMPQPMLTNSFFNKNLLKRRIIMLYQKKSGKTARLKYLVALPLLAVLICISTLAFTKNYGWVDLAPKAITILKERLPFIKKEKRTIKVYNTNKSVKDLDGLDSNTIYNKVDINPVFPAGENGFGKFLSENIKYPKSAKDQNIQGRVFIQFIVETDGSLSDIKALRSPDATLADEALRVINLSPKWTPGKQNGQNVRVKYTVPINFSLEKNGVQTSQQVSKPVDNIIAHQNQADSVFSEADVNPSFPGGEAKFRDFLGTNVHYPAVAKQANIQGRVFVKFIVEKDGSLSNMKVLRDPGSGLGDEALRVLSLSPKWTPGTRNGKPVRVQYTVPINFSLGNIPKQDVNQKITYPINFHLSSIEQNPQDTNKKNQNSSVQVKCSFPGGYDAFMQYIKTAIRYPKKAHDDKITGQAVVKFYIEKDGTIKDAELLRDPGYGLGDEALRVIKLSPKWIPGVQNGQAVRVWYTVPVNFALN